MITLLIQLFSPPRHRNRTAIVNMLPITVMYPVLVHPVTLQD